MCTYTIVVFYGYSFFKPIFTALLDVEHDCLDTCCFGWFISICFTFLYLHLQFGAIEHVSHGKAL